MTASLATRTTVLGIIALAGALLGTPAGALECGDFRFPACHGPEQQYAGGFTPEVGFGGFGGGDCTAEKTPVVFVHGNGDKAINWDSPIEDGVGDFAAPLRSVYDELRHRGYNACELFGVTYLDEQERQAAGRNYHRPAKYEILKQFVDAVKAYTGKDRVDVVAHSLGVSMTLATLKYYDAWDSVRRFVNIAGGIRGLNSCLYVGYANPLATTCGSQNAFNPYVFGFYPSGAVFGRNGWTAASGPFSLRGMPADHPEVDFYTLHAGLNDEIHCTTLRGSADCRQGALFVDAPNVKAQLNVGAGSTALKADFDFSDFSPFVALGGDVDGIGHFKAKNYTGEIVYTMLNTDCTDLQCKGSYNGGPVLAD